MSKKLGLSLLLVFVLAMGAVAVEASNTPDTTLPPPSFTDGRLNSYDTGAPVIIYETHKNIPVLDSEGLVGTATVIDGVQLLAWSGASDSAKQVLDVSVDKINAAIAKNKKPTFTIAQANGYALNYSNSGWFWVTTPPDAEGKVYTFQWQKDF
ncbi:MAG: hypothetical protein GC179_20535 [Anaerolineaceae bacterium]|nr:hypothetical protein [Anaerolineaceae bacterium]